MRIQHGPAVIALGLTVLWFVTNVRHFSPLDVLPFAWTWLTLWIALSIAQEIARWCLYALTSQRVRS